MGVLLDQLKRIDAEIVALKTVNTAGKPLFVPSRENIEKAFGEMQAIRTRLGKLQASAQGEPEKLLAGHLEEVLASGQAHLLAGKTQPNKYLTPILHRINQTLDKYSPKMPERPKKLNAALDQGMQVLEGASSLVEKVPRANLSLIVDTLDKISAGVPAWQAGLEESFSEADFAKLNDLSVKFRALGKKAADLKSFFLTASSRVQADTPPDYGEILKNIYGVELDELLSWYKEEVERCETAFFALGKEIDPRRHPLQILEEDLPAAENPKAMFASFRECLNTAREQAQRYVALPAGEECHVVHVPEHLKDYFPWGGYIYGGDVLKGELKGQVFLNQYNYENISRGWIYLLSIHECYPGHHTQFTKTAAGNMPLTFKVGAAVPLTEGIALRSETLMQHIFGDPAFPLFAAYRRLHAALRIWADLLLHYFREDEEKAIALYVKHLGLTNAVASGQVKSQIITPGYFTAYYYGLRHLESLQEESRLSDKDFTELIFSCGKLSLNSLRKLSKFSPEDHHKLYGGFR